LYDSAAPFFLTRTEQNQLASDLKTIGGIADLKMTIHDPFLWRAFNPETPFPQGGCQAANTMIAISPDGGVYPCPTLPVRLGELSATSLHEILHSAAKKDFRRRILAYPQACEACAELAVCKGGCRGRSFVLHASMDAVDDACR
jgi:GeoRSP system SPASM domain protein